MRAATKSVCLALCAILLCGVVSASDDTLSDARSLECTSSRPPSSLLSSSSGFWLSDVRDETACKATITTAEAAMKTAPVMNKVLGALDAHCIPVANYTESVVRVRRQAKTQKEKASHCVDLT